MKILTKDIDYQAAVVAGYPNEFVFYRDPEKNLVELQDQIKLIEMQLERRKEWEEKKKSIYNDLLEFYKTKGYEIT